MATSTGDDSVASRTMYPVGTEAPRVPRSPLCDPVDAERINGASSLCERVLLERVRVRTRGRLMLREFMMKFLEWLTLLIEMAIS